jgi:hypothetical protein
MVYTYQLFERNYRLCFQGRKALLLTVLRIHHILPVTDLFFVIPRENLLEKLTVTQLIKRFSAFLETGKIISVFIGSSYWALF